MLKNRALRRKRIALYLAVMLMFCAFCVDVTATGERDRLAGTGQQETALVQPRAGEFFTGSLPLEERQSVCEVSGEWRTVLSVRTSRTSGFRNGTKGTGVCIAQPDGLHGLTVTQERSVESNGLSIAHCREIIMCYIHNQDGAKG